MKIEQVLVYYLLKHKHLHLQGLGTFTLESVVAEPSEPNRPIVIPEGAISFVRDSKVQEDPELVQFISEHTGKITPLASADLDSYLMLGRQFLHIGNPFIIPGIGTIEKSREGDFVFKGGSHVADRLESRIRAEEETGSADAEENLFTEYQRETKKNTGRTVLIVIGILIIGLIGWAVWKYALHPDGEPDNITHATHQESAPTEPSGAVTPLPADSPAVATSPASEVNSFRLIVNQYDTREAAEKRYTNLRTWGRNVVMYTKDSVTYNIALEFNRPLSDSTHVLDSVQKEGYFTSKRGKIDY